MLTSNLTFKSILDGLIQVNCILYFNNDIEDVIINFDGFIIIRKQVFFYSDDKIS